MTSLDGRVAIITGTGRFADATACQVGYVPFDYRRHRWAGRQRRRNRDQCRIRLCQ